MATAGGCLYIRFSSILICNEGKGRLQPGASRQFRDISAIWRRCAGWLSGYLWEHYPEALMGDRLLAYLRSLWSRSAVPTNFAASRVVTWPKRATRQEWWSASGPFALTCGSQGKPPGTWCRGQSAALLATALRHWMHAPSAPMGLEQRQKPRACHGRVQGVENVLQRILDTSSTRIRPNPYQ